MREEEKLRILAVEDSSADFRLLKEFLNEDHALDFELTQAQTIKFALDILALKRFDVVLLDLNLPDGTGLKNLERIYSSNTRAPVIVFTGLDDEKTGTGALKKGAQDYLVKGKIKSDSLIRSIRYAVERRAVEEALNKERENLRAIFDVVSIGLLLIDEKGVVKQVNNTVSLWMGKDFSLPQDKQPGNIVGCVHALSSPDGCGRSVHCPTCPIRNTFEQVLETGKPIRNIETQVTLILNGKDNSLWFEVNVDPIILDGKRHAILSLNNITARKQAEEILMRDKDNFEKLVNEKTRELINVQMKLEQAKRLSDIGTLAATVAHELRNPLAAIKMASYNAQRKAQNPLLDKHFSNIEIKLHESENIIDNLLFYSKIRVPHCAPINIHNILSVCIEDTKARFPGHKVSIIRKDSPLKKLLVEADAVQIREIFANLLNNSFDAVGQRKVGLIEIRAEVEGRNIKISVKDNGAGISKENLERIFQPFFSTKAKGTGLGLTVAQQVVELHGGSIGLESQEGKGTTITISLPIKHELNA